MARNLQDTHLDLLIHLDRLLTEADKVRTLRDRLIEVTQDEKPPIAHAASQAEPTEVVR